MSNAHVWQREPSPITDFVDEETADVVVVGAGMAGTVAAQSAAETGASVVLVEKFSEPVAHGIDVGAVDSVLQRRAGIQIDKLDAARLIYAWSQQQANYNLIRTFVERSGEVMTHYVEMAEAAGYTVHLNTEATARADWGDLDDRFRMFRTAHVFDAPDDLDVRKTKWNAQYIVDVAYADALKLGVKFMFNTRAERLIKEDGRVVGVAATDSQGTHKILARRGVIMATGGITDNDEMKECFCPMSLRVDKNAYFPRGGNMGEGHIISAWAGAVFSRCYPAPIIHPVNFTPLGPGIDSSWLIVNRKGQRFMNETAYEPIITNARLNAPGNVAWAIWDSDYLEHYKAMEPVKYAALPEDIVDRVEKSVETGEYFRADTLAELAGELGIPADNLEATVARYNELVDAGEDVDFEVPPRFLSPCKKGPFYAGRINAELLSVLYGMRVNDNSQMVDVNDDPIPGLYAVGAIQGDFFANSYPVTVPGADHGRAMTFGRLVGCALAKGENIDGTPAE
ncbi:MAG: FAD-binding protein [Coriobacteriales bacterium]|jgi:fumarate reductase flavoprotein subunit